MFAHIGVDVDGFAASVHNVRYDLRAALIVDVGNDNLCAIARQQFGSRAADPVVKIPADSQGRSLVIKRAKFGAVPAESTGTWVMLCLMLFIASFAIGPGVCVWLALSELMPTRIRSLGMGLGLLINQGVSTLIAAVFLPIVGNHGYTSIFIFWAICTVLYFAVAAFWLPETKGRTLEEIEAHFAK